MAEANPAPVKTVKVDIRNPLRCSRVIYDGLAAQTAYHIPAGKHLSNVILSEAIAVELKKRKKDLTLHPPGTLKADKPKPPAKGDGAAADDDSEVEDETSEAA